MLASVRRNAIYDIIREQKSATVSALAQRFSVTEETIRRDLSALQEKGLVLKSYGGAFIQDGVQNNVAANIRSHVFVQEKQLIARQARRLVSNGDTIFLDESTTAYWVATAVEGMRLTVLTNNLPIINLLAGRPAISLIAIGGIYSAQDEAFFGEMAIRSLENRHVDSAFLSCRSLSLDAGMTEGHENAAMLRREVTHHADRVYAIVDHTKFGRSSFLEICGLEAVDALITDQPLGPEWHERAEALSCQILEGDTNEINAS